jgi:hypothetical protein
MASDKAELRGLACIDLVKALDALAQADGMDRNEYVNKVLDLHVKSECHRTTLRVRMLRGNPYLTDSTGALTE